MAFVVQVRLSSLTRIGHGSDGRVRLESLTYVDVASCKPSGGAGVQASRGWGWCRRGLLDVRGAAASDRPPAGPFPVFTSH